MTMRMRDKKGNHLLICIKTNLQSNWLNSKYNNTRGTEMIYFHHYFCIFTFVLECGNFMINSYL